MTSNPDEESIRRSATRSVRCALTLSMGLLQGLLGDLLERMGASDYETTWSCWAVAARYYGQGLGDVTMIGENGGALNVVRWR